MAIDAVLLILCSMVSMWIVYAAYDATVVLFTVIASLILLLSLSLTRFYLIRVSEGSLDLVNRAFTGFLLPSLVSILIPVFLEGYHSSWIPYFVVFWGSSFLCILGVRFAYRSFRTYYTKQTHNNNPRTVIYGAGELGNALVRQFQRGKLPYHISAFIDDNASLKGTYLLGIKVWGTIDDLAETLVHVRAKVLIIAITHIEQERMFKAVDAAKELGVDIKVIPSLFEMQQGAKELDLRNLDYGDLLGRPLISIEKQPIQKMVMNKRVLITGAGGSIGSEICKQLLTYGPSQLILLDIDETELHDLSLRLHNYQKEWSDLIVPVVCDIKNRRKVDRIMEQYRPQLVFHAAAYKHVPLQELYPEEAITTNILGSYAGCSRVPRSALWRRWWSSPPTRRSTRPTSWVRPSAWSSSWRACSTARRPRWSACASATCWEAGGACCPCSWSRSRRAFRSPSPTRTSSATSWRFPRP